MALYVSESLVNASEGYRFYDSEEPEPTNFDTPGEVYRYCLREYGRCACKIYVDSSDGPLHIGWVFVKRAQYDDCEDTYLREAWIMLHDGPRPPRPPAPYHVIGRGRS